MANGRLLFQALLLHLVSDIKANNYNCRLLINESATGAEFTWQIFYAEYAGYVTFVWDYYLHIL